VHSVNLDNEVANVVLRVKFSGGQKQHGDGDNYTDNHSVHGGSLKKIMLKAKAVYTKKQVVKLRDAAVAVVSLAGAAPNSPSRWEDSEPDFSLTVGQGRHIR